MDHAKILIVDDDVNNLMTLTSMIEQNLPNYEVFQTNRPQNVCAIAQKVKPHLIITDWDMPGLSGIDLVTALKSDLTLKNIPVIIATGVMLTSVDLNCALEAGAFDYIRKPIDAIELKARIFSALSITQMHKELLLAKDKELTARTLQLGKNKEFQVGLKRKLESFASIMRLNDAEETIFSDIIKDVNDNIVNYGREQFDLSFAEVHPLFKTNLLKRFHSLTPGDTRLCSFIRMGMSNKEISTILNQSPDSVKVSRSRLRNKLMLETRANLENFLMQF